MQITVDLALVLAVDCSSSVDAGDFRMQMDGIAAALRHPPLLDAIAAGSSRRIAITLVQWSSHDSQNAVVPWRVLAGVADVAGMAHDVEKAERQWKPGGTGLADAITYCAALLKTSPFIADRLVIDVSGDGEDNDGGDVAHARDEAVAQGITINGLPIIGGAQRLARYYQAQVIGGPGSFILPAKDMRSFKEAMTKKLLKEITQAVA